MHGHIFEGMELLLLLGLLACLVPLLGHYLIKVYNGSYTCVHAPCRWLENLCYYLSGINPTNQMNWISYLTALLCFNFLGFLLLFTLLLLQGFLPLNPQHLAAPAPSLAFNIAISFVTNTNWQAYSGETTLSYLSQMLGLTVQNFLSSATGISALLVLMRGLTYRTITTVGNFWVDLVRSVIYVLLPLSLLMSIVLISQGVIQSLSPYVEATTLEGQSQTIPLGPVASQVAIKQLGTNGGGFFGVNSAHPFENPTALSNFIETLALILIPAALVYGYGLFIKSRKHALLLLSVMFFLWGLGLAASLYSESVYNPILEAYPLLEGKETRFGVFDSILWSLSTTGTGNGSVNSMISSLSPLAGGIALFNIMIGQLIFGGVGVGLCHMIIYVLLTVFLAGLLVGRTPEYLGKKIEKREVTWVVLAILIPGGMTLVGAGLSSIFPQALSSLGNAGLHGLSELLYAFASAAFNNGSAFAGLDANTPYYNIVLGIVMLFGRLSIITASIAIGGLLANKKIVPISIGTFSTNTFFFAVMLTSVIFITGGLSFFPALSLGPLMEQILMLQNRAF